ncbi:Glutamine synthetase type I (EC [Kitasatospora purpeofusca]
MPERAVRGGESRAPAVRRRGNGQRGRPQVGASEPSAALAKQAWGWAACGPSEGGRRWPVVPDGDHSTAADQRLNDPRWGWHQFLRNKKQEWEEYRSEVTPFELRKNLQVL